MALAHACKAIRDLQPSLHQLHLSSCTAQTEGVTTLIVSVVSLLVPLLTVYYPVVLEARLHASVQ